MNVEGSGAVGGYDKQARIEYLRGCIAGWEDSNRNLNNSISLLKQENNQLDDDIQKYKKMKISLISAIAYLQSGKAEIGKASQGYSKQYTSGSSRATSTISSINGAMGTTDSVIGSLQGLFGKIDAKVKEKEDKVKENKKKIESNEKARDSNDMQIKIAKNQIAFLQESM